jgi:hypothetical protein
MVNLLITVALFAGVKSAFLRMFASGHNHWRTNGRQRYDRFTQ